MTSDIDIFINATASKIGDLYAGILKEILSQYANETKRQHAIRGMIKLYEHQYGPEIRRHDRDMKRYKETRDNEYASNNQQQLRVTFRLPDSLATRINMILKPPVFPLDEPTFLSEEASKMYGEDIWFKDNFKRYTVPERF